MAKARDFDLQVAIIYKPYDGEPLHAWCMNRGVARVIPLKETGP